MVGVTARAHAVFIVFIVGLCVQCANINGHLETQIPSEIMFPALAVFGYLFHVIVDIYWVAYTAPPPRPRAPRPSRARTASPAPAVAASPEPVAADSDSAAETAPKKRKYSRKPVVVPSE